MTTSDTTAIRTRPRALLGLTASAALALGLTAPAHAAPPERSYEVTITNLTDGQPLSPALVVTHRRSVDLFDVGGTASPAIVAIAEDGDASVGAAALAGVRGVTSIATGVPVTPAGTNAVLPGGVAVDDDATVELTARPGDVLSLASMLICTNDGFTGLDEVRLPRRGAVSIPVAGYDAGSEINTEQSTAVVDPCSLLGPVVLDGDPNGNVNDGLDEDGRIAHHPGVDGTVGDLLPAHDWDGPVAVVTIERID